MIVVDADTVQIGAKSEIFLIEVIIVVDAKVTVNPPDCGPDPRLP